MIPMQLTPEGNQIKKKRKRKRKEKEG